MNTQFTQPDKLVAVQTNKQAIARDFGLKSNQVAYLSTSITVDSYAILYDKSTQTSWFNTAVGAPISWAIAGSVMTLVTSSGTYSLQQAKPLSTKTFQDLMSSPTQIADYPEWQLARWRDEGDFRGWSPKGDGTTDDTAALNTAIASFGTSGGTLKIPKYPNGAERRYLISDWSAVNNPYGVKFVGEGALVSPAAATGYTQHNLYANGFRVSYGQEYLYRIYKRFEGGQQATIHMYGDSTVASGNGEDTGYASGVLLFDMFQSAGLITNVVNKGVGGSSVYEMTAVNDLTANTDLFIIKYGINDGGTPGSGDRLANFATALRSKLAELRAAQYGSIHNLSIILVGPNSTNDTQHNRDAIWYEKLKGIYLQAARDYQCAYFDTYGFMPDVENAAGYSMDNPFGNGQGVHPMNTMQCWIWGNLVDTYFSKTSIEKYRTNNFINAPSSEGVPDAATLLVNYRRGITIYRATIAKGWILDGSVITIRSSDDVGRQLLVTFSNGLSKTIQRTWNTSTSAWNAWTGTANGLTPANNWVAAATPEARVSAEGLVTISAKLTGGTTTSGTQILTGLPVAMRPAVEKRFAITNDNGTHTCVGVSTSGSIFLVGSAADATAGIHVNLSYYV